MSLLPKDFLFGSNKQPVNPGYTSSGGFFDRVSGFNPSINILSPASPSAMMAPNITQQIMDMPLSNPDLTGGVLPTGGGGNGGFFSGMNTSDKINLGLGGLQTLGSLWGAFQSMKLANKQYKFTKNVTSTNLNNQIKSYNTTLDDKARSRGKVEGQSAQQTQDYINKNKLADFKS